MAKNENLHKAKKAKNDEFYTRIEDIEQELKYYSKYFENKTIFCNCDDPEWSNFWKYFQINFHNLGLKKLISTHFEPDNKTSYKLEWTGDFISGQTVNMIKTPLKGNGDFRSDECVELLKEADIIVTNPPFSLFREYIKQLMDYNKMFIIIGNKNAVNYLCPLIKENKLWFGYNSVHKFLQPDGTFKTFGNIGWYTNLDHKKRHQDLLLWKKYYDEKGNPPNHNEKYPKYDNYDAIEISIYDENKGEWKADVNSIPIDYDGVMGVPISFLDKYNPNQFEIIGVTYSTDKNPDIEKVRTDTKHRHVGIIDGHEKYPRILIKWKRNT